MRRSLLPCVVAAALLAALGGPASAQNPARTLWVDPRLVDLADPQVVADLLRQPVQRIVVSGFTGGRTLFPTKSTLFTQLSRYRDKPDILAALAEQARARDQTVYVAVDCFHWAPADVPADEDVLARHPELAELDAAGGFGAPGDGKYASPFHPQVRQALRELVAETAGRYPKLDGVLLDPRLPAGVVLGYNPTARRAFQKKSGQDPLELPAARWPDALDELLPWSNWRVTQCTTLVHELSAAFRARNQTGQVAAVVSADYYPSVASQLTRPTDWLNWASDQAVQEVVLDGRWDRPADGELYLFNRRRAEGRPIACAALLPPIEGPDAEEGLRALLLQNAAGIVVVLDKPEDRERLARFFQETLPRLEKSPLEVQTVHLKGDPRLQAPITASLKAPTAEQVLSLLRQTTRLRLPTNDKIDPAGPAFGSLSLINTPALEVMQMLADSKSVNGQWVRVDGEYRLEGTYSPPVPAPASGRSPWLWWLTGSVIVVMAGVSAWFLGRAWRARVKAKGSRPRPQRESSTHA